MRSRGKAGLVAVATLAAGALLAIGEAGAVSNGRIVFVSDRNGGPELYTMNADGSGVTQITSDGYVVSKPVWNWQGTKIAFVSARLGPDTEIYTVNPDGSGLMQVTDNGLNDNDPSWSPDGTKIAFRSFSSDTGGDISVVNVAGGGEISLTGDLNDDGNPAWSPYGDVIAFDSDREGAREIFAISPAGGPVTRLTNEAEPASSPQWSGNGSRIVFSTPTQVVHIRADGTSRQTLPEGSGDADWAPDGSRLVFVAGGDIYTADPDGGSVVRITSDAAADFAPDWQPLDFAQPVPRTTRVSVSSAGVQADNLSRGADVSEGGRYVVFHSYASNLVEGDTNGRADVFRHDRQTGATILVSSGGGGIGNGDSTWPSVSGDGRFVAFESLSTNLHPADGFHGSDIYVKDIDTGALRIASSNPDLANQPSYAPDISRNGLYVAYYSTASNLAGGDTNGASDIFLWERTDGVVELVSRTPAGGLLNGSSQYPAISGNGTVVAYSTSAANADPAGNSTWNVYARNVATGAVTRASVTHTGEGQPNNTSGYSGLHPIGISDDGTRVAFESWASNLVPVDANGSPDVFVRDLTTSTTFLASVAPGGGTIGSSGFGSNAPSLSGDGSRVAFDAYPGLGPGDLGGSLDVYIRDLDAGSTFRATFGYAGNEANHDSGGGRLSGDGSVLVFDSIATNVVPFDTNGAADIFASDLQPAVVPETTIVNATADTDDGACTAVHCTLREAINASNATAGVQTIGFQILTGLQTIQPLSPLPPITQPVVIDGTTQPGFAGKPLIELDGSRAGGAAAGLYVLAADVTIKGLIVNRFARHGIEVGNLELQPGGATIQRNWIGLDASGTIPAPNAWGGLIVWGSGSTIGGETPPERNVVSGNSAYGVRLNGTTNVVEGNFIGTNAAGTGAVPNVYGVFASGHENVIGGTTSGARNLISGNSQAGVIVWNGGPIVRQVRIEGNLIGLNAFGSAPLPNAVGVEVRDGAAETVIGGAPNAKNVVSGNTNAGIVLERDGGDTVIQSNLIGTTPGGGDFGNDGPGIASNSQRTVIGGRTLGRGNTIMFNAFGVRLHDDAQAEISGNGINLNDGLGIDLVGATPGFTENDPGDADAGPNDLLNFPTIIAAERGGGNVRIDGRLVDSEAGTSFLVDVYWSNGCDPLGHGEGRRYLGAVPATTDATGSAEFSLLTETVVPIGATITATATRGGMTSEFSECATLIGAPDPAVLRVSGSFIDSLDTAFAYSAPSWQLLRSTCAGLLTYDGSELVPDVATGMPEITNGGRRYEFTLRSDFHFAPGAEAVTPDAFQRALERALSPRSGSPAAALFLDIEGAEDFHAGDEDFIEGVVSFGSTLRITLEEPAGDFLARLSTPFACAVPPSTPDFPQQRLPAAGPYYIASYDEGDFARLVENPEYPGPRQHVFDEIEYQILPSQVSALAQVESGNADYVAGGVLPSERERLETALGPGSTAAASGEQQYFIHDSALIRNIALNNERPLFSDVRVRRAFNIALRRTRLAAITRDKPSDQYLPHGVPGYVDADLYPLDPDAEDVAEARALVEAAGAVGANAVLYTCNLQICTDIASEITASLAPLGITTTIQVFPRAEQLSRTATHGEPFDISHVGWAADYLDPFDFVNVLLDGNRIASPPVQGTNFSYFDDAYWNARMRAAAELTGDARTEEYRRLDHELATGPAPQAVYAMGRQHDLFSARIGCQRFQALLHIDLGALCVRTPVTAATAIAAADTMVPAGVAEVRLADVPVQHLDLDFGSAIGSAPLEDIPLEDIPLEDIPLEDIPLEDIGLLDPALRAALDQVLLSSIPLSTPGGWEAVLAGTQYAGRPPQTVTLGQVLALDPLPPQLHPPANSAQQALRLGDVERGNSVLSRISVVALALGGTPLEHIGVPGPSQDALANWCALLSGPPISCSQNSPGGLAGTSLIGLDLSGVPLEDIPLEDIPLSRIPLEDIPLEDIPLEDINILLSPLEDIPLRPSLLAVDSIRNIPLEDIPLEDIPLRSPLHAILISDTLSPGKVVACPVGTDCVTPDLTLGEAAEAGLISPAATLGDLGADALALFTLGDFGFYGTATIGDLWAELGDLSLGDLLRALVPRAALPWEDVQLDSLPLLQLAATGGQLGFTVDVQVSGAGAPATQRFQTEAAVRLPVGWQFVPGSAHLIHPDSVVPPRQLPDPGIVDGVARWTFGIEPVGVFKVAFLLRSGLTLGLSTPVSASIVAEGGSTAATDEVAVQVGDTFEPNDTPAEAVEIAPDSLIFSFVAEGDDLDYFSFPAPAPGSRITVHLSHLSSDADLVLYTPEDGVLRPPAPLRAPAPGAVLDDEDRELDNIAQGLQPDRLQDIPLVQGRHVAGVSINRQTAGEEISTVSAHEGGHYLIQVSPYNRERSDSAYVLRVQVFAPPPDAQCDAPTFDFPAAGVPGTLPASLPAGVDTVFLVNRERFGDSYGASAETALAQIRAQLPALGALGHNAFLAEIDGDPGVAAAYEQWDANPCSAVRANAVVREIGELLDRLRAASPTLRHVVLVGGDRVVPFARLRDGARIANERDFATEFPQGSSLRGSLAGENVLSDDPYGTIAPIGVDRPLYVPSLAVGRLVETPGEISAAVTQFVLFGGRLDPATKSSLTTGYDFLRDGSEGIEAQLSQLVPAAHPRSSTTTAGRALRSSPPSSALRRRGSRR